MTSSEKQLIGSRSRSTGAAFEKLIEVSCEVYKSRGLAYIEKTPEPMRPISGADRQGKFTAIYTAAAQPDYKGTLSGGRAVVFEAKHTDSDTMKQERVTPAQAEALRIHYELGALCFVLISIKDRCFAIPWEVWDNMKQIYGRKYITASDVKEYEVKIKANKGSVYLDFLSAAVKREADMQNKAYAVAKWETVCEAPEYALRRKAAFTESKVRCPFCKGENENARIFEDEENREYFVYCPICNIETVDSYKSKERALKNFLEGKNQKICEERK